MSHSHKGVYSKEKFFNVVVVICERERKERFFNPLKCQVLNVYWMLFFNYQMKEAVVATKQTRREGGRGFLIRIQKRC